MNDGGLAYPQPLTPDPETGQMLHPSYFGARLEGLTVRDAFAVQIAGALAGRELCPASESSDNFNSHVNHCKVRRLDPPSCIASLAYDLAQALVDERTKRNQQTS